MIDILAYLFIILGICFDLFGCIGLVRLPDVYNRLQASAKCVTIGTCGILLGVFLKFGLSAAGMKAVVCILFLLLTSPVAAHALSRAAHRAGVRLWDKSVCDEYSADNELRK